MAEDYPKTILELERRFGDEAACRSYLFALRWAEGFVRPHCQTKEGWSMANGRWLCVDCRAQVSVMAGTIFQDSKLPLTTWFRAMWQLTSQKNGVSALGLQRQLGLGSYKTAWTMLHKLRRARAITEFLHRVEASAAAVQPEHQIVFRAPGRFGGWPANHGGWSWGDELLVGFAAGWHQQQDAARHQIDRSRPPESAVARSVDGGRTWNIERPSGLLGSAAAVAALRPLATPVDFQRPGFALTLRYHEAVSYFQYSYDRGRTWHGPHALPRLDSPGWQARTDYLVHGPRELTAFVTALKRDGREGRPAALRTTDGGLTWTRRSDIGPEPAGFAIMPSTLALDDGSWLATIRVKDATGSWIDAWRSVDRGGSWQPAGRPVPDAGGTSGNPPHLIRLRDGRLCLTYGYRSPPYGIRARLSADGGRTWEPEIILRSDAAAHDLGYPRSVQRSDGRIVSVYYYNDGIHSERFIAATTWNPGPDLPP